MRSIYSLFSMIIFSIPAFTQSGSIEYTSSGTFTVPDDVTSVFAEIVGAGGSGGGNGTGGGGGGAYSSGNIPVTPGQMLLIFIGTGGTDAATGTTFIDGFMMATGGENGVSVPNPEIGGGGFGGVAYGGNIANYAGGNGGGGYYTYFGGGGGGAAGPFGNGGDGGNTIAWTGICLTSGGDGGLSAGAPGGNGGKGAGFTDDFCTVTDPSENGFNYGGGGGGGNGNGGLPGNGANGFARIIWCAIDVSILMGDATVHANAEDATYQWIDCANGNSPIEGEINQDFTPLVNGSYAVIVSDGICSDTSECFDVTIIVEGINDEQLISTYTNPFNDHIQIQNADVETYYYLTNSIGQKMWSGKMIGNEIFSNLPVGLYLLKMELNNKQQVITLIKQ